ncbi:SpoIIE family protein phosphatase [Desulfococcaceae bacterium OttesenSCG-928-F15]|nr:SpoIIE family protein phosphatase [Desulfococcaceae bacterium OttesenSCG-928-F15]
MIPGLKTIRAKIVLVIVFVIAALSFAMILLFAHTLSNYKALQIAGCRSLIAMHSDDINDAIHKLQDNALELALNGELFFRHLEKRSVFGRYAVMQNFRINTLAVGGGIWYEPFFLDPEKERVCFYAFNKNGHIVFDEGFESDTYHYPSQSWYLSIKKQIVEEKKTYAWTRPYVDGAGTQALMTTVGGGIYNEQGQFVGMSTVDWRIEDIITQVVAVRPTENSFVLLADFENDFILALTDGSWKGDPEGASLKTLSWFDAHAPAEREMVYEGVHYLSFKNRLDNNMLVIINIPTEELFKDITRDFKYMVIILVASVLLVILASYWLLDLFINAPVVSLSGMAEEIGAGKLDTRVKLRSRDELGRLAGTLNKMAEHLTEYIGNLGAVTAEKERIEAELSIAQNIQASMLPSIFPPFPDRKEFCIHALMIPAKEVGGDFYDFFFWDPDHLVMVIADVSDKGVPAALFMVIAKTLIKNNTLLHEDIAEVFEKTNVQLCENNGTGMFVTAFMGVLNVRTGVFSYVNAGHCAPFLRRAGFAFEKLKVRPGFVLAGFESTRYEADHIRLAAGDCLFLYTDGVTEAGNAEGELFGEGRLMRALCSRRLSDAGVTGLLSGVRTAIDDFVQDAPQSDDMAMLGLVYRNRDVFKDEACFLFVRERHVPASLESLPQILQFVGGELEELQCDPQKQMRFQLAVEEAFVNIVNYAYPDLRDGEKISLRLDILDVPRRIALYIADTGIPFNPLEKPDPDISLSAEERQAGGLGVFLIRQNTDKVEYARENGYNILKLSLMLG